MSRPGDQNGGYLRWRNIDYQPVVRDLPPETLLEVLKPGQRVLEIGCGVGSNLVRLASHGLVVEGWDINPSAIRAAQIQADAAGLDERVTLVADDFLSCARLPEPADAVVLIRVLTCVPEEAEWRELLCRVERTIKCGGALYVRDFLLSPQTYSARYEDGRSRGWRFGTFSVPKGREPPEFNAYHHSEADLEVICAPYHVVSLRREEGLSLSGNATNMFELLARKPGRTSDT